MQRMSDTTNVMREQRIHIEPSRGWPKLELRERYHHRELLFFLIWRDIKVRYKQTVLRAAWAIIQAIVHSYSNLINQILLNSPFSYHPQSFFE